MRKRGRLAETNIIAGKINLLIQQALSKELSKLSQATPKELWASVKNTRTNSSASSTYSLHLLADTESVNRYFSDICTDPLYNLANVMHYINFSVKYTCDGNTKADALPVYDVEKMLRFIKCSSPGMDGIPSWFFRNCSYEIADVVTHILKLSFSSGVVPQQWRCAIVTPVPKVPKPSDISDFRPISASPLLSRLAECILVRKWLLPSIPADMLPDQFGF